MRLSLTLVSILALVAGLAVAAPADDDMTGAETLGWKLAIQAWTNNQATLHETLELASRIGFEYVEAFPGQKLTPDAEGGMGPGMTDEQVQALLDKMDECGVKIVAFGVTGIPGGDDAKGFFEWCKKTGIETVTTEPGEDQIAEIAEAAAEYEIGIAIHNHPQPSHYWNPDTVLTAVEGAPDNVGACADTGHWVRSGLDPIECLKKLEGRIISLHFKDLGAREGDGMHDVIWGTGASDAAGQMAELKRQGFKGVISMEFEHQWDEPTLAKCVEFFNAEADKLAAE